MGISEEEITATMSKVIMKIQLSMATGKSVRVSAIIYTSCKKKMTLTSLKIAGSVVPSVDNDAISSICRFLPLISAQRIFFYIAAERIMVVMRLEVKPEVTHISIYRSLGGRKLKGHDCSLQQMFCTRTVP